MDALDFDQVFAGLPKVRFPYDASLPVRGWLMQGAAHQVVLWYTPQAYESTEHRHPYAEWGVVITGWCEVTTPEGTRRYASGEAFYLPPDVPHASRMSDEYRAIDIFFTAGHVQAEP